MKKSLLFLAALVALFAGCTALQSTPPKRYVISELGAVGDGQTVNTKAIQAAIDQCAAAGGGVIVVPKGTFLSGALYFKQGVNLLVEKDGVLKSTITIADFPPIYTRWEGIERYWTSAFLNFVGMKNVSVSGEGIIDGSGDAWANFGQNARLATPPGGAPAGGRGNAQPGGAGAGGGRRGGAPGGGGQFAGFGGPPAPTGPLPKPADVFPLPLPTTSTISLWRSTRDIPVVNAAGVAIPRGGGSGGVIGTPPRSVVFQDCSDVRVSGLTIKNEARWGWVFIYCENVVAENLKSLAEHYIPSSDGMDVDSCRHVLITGCYFDCNDDCLSIKSGKDEDGRRVNRPCEDIVVEKTTFAYGHGGAAMGSETSGGIRNVEVRDCVANAGNWAPIRFKTQPSRGGMVENITYRNLELKDTRQMVEFNLEWNMRINVAGDTRVIPTVRNVQLINVHGTTASVGMMHGLYDSYIEGITFVNCDITAQKGLVIENAHHVDTSGLKLSVKEGEAITVREVKKP
ncbi:MAG TPA: glycosyl hydrolase family 28 protein [Opitutaceae bacterium]|nr:glycosyl hydrolase family 28 protein [Opitutaceae bacterium]